MGLIDVFLPKKYKNGKVLFEQNLDAWRLAAENAFATINLNLTQIAKDSFLANYDFTNDGDMFTAKSLQQQILDLASGGIPLSGTTSDTWTINTDGNAATLSTFGLGADYTFTFPDCSGELTVNTCPQILTNKTLTSPIINTPTINTATINSASFSGTVTSVTTFTWTIGTPTSAIVINKTDVGAGDVIDITNAGIGHDIVGNAGNWFINPDGSASFTSVSGMGLVPIGTILPWWDFAALLTLPTGFLYCDGTVIATVGSPLLGQTLPNLSGRYLVGFGTVDMAPPSDIGTAPFSSSPVGAALNELNFAHSHTVTSHSHTISSDGNHNHGGRNSGMTTTAGSDEVSWDYRVKDDANAGYVNRVAGSKHIDTSSGSQDEGQHGHTIDNDGSHNHTGSTGSAFPTTNSQLSATQNIQPRSIGVRFIMRVI